YCIEEELILRRRFEFPASVGAGDMLAIPNTAGYLMHIVESASHQLPLAANVLLAGEDTVLDEIDLPSSAHF
ncbi:MAG: Y4yA family PLP-dependent enzyme, partial [Acidobacteria bacterium]|nr:Y4yA family PLP-dependent enzyme [Acidobacteriota bacterium]